MARQELATAAERPPAWLTQRFEVFQRLLEALHGDFEGGQRGAGGGGTEAAPARAGGADAETVKRRSATGTAYQNRRQVGGTPGLCGGSAPAGAA